MKNVFCLEGLWSNDLSDKSTVKPVLELLHQYKKMKYIHRDCATIPEFEFYIKKWTQKGYTNYPILYLSFHGEEGAINFSGEEKITLDELSELLENKCKNKIVVFASCSTLDIHGNSINSFIKKTGCLAVCGYRSDVDWVRATAFEMLMFDTMQENKFCGQGIKALDRKLTSLSKSFKDLEFRIVTK